MLYLVLVILIIVLLSLLPKNNEHFSNLGDENVIMTTYFCNKNDPQRPKRAPCNDFQYIKPWYNSIKKLGLNGVVFHDGMSDNFIKQYQTEKIKFVYVDSNSYEFSLNDLRYFVYHDFLSKNKNIKNVFMTDGNDVTIVKSPFNKFTGICVGKEELKINDSKWMKQKIKNFNSNNINKFNYNSQSGVYNAGILGGNRNEVMNFLKFMIKIFNNLDEKQRRDNLNMIVFNYVVYNNYKQKVNTGEPLHSVYKKFENNRKDVYFIHK
tara:strand:+ start:1859 stop:2653 length:795 start_codon:yes stop_codon:yes gene_type:complete